MAQRQLEEATARRDEIMATVMRRDDDIKGEMSKFAVVKGQNFSAAKIMKIAGMVVKGWAELKELLKSHRDVAMVQYREIMTDRMKSILKKWFEEMEISEQIAKMSWEQAETQFDAWERKKRRPFLRSMFRGWIETLALESDGEQ